MSRIDALTRRVQRLEGTPNSLLEEEWNNLCAGAKDELIAMLEAKIAAHPEEEEPAGEDLDPVELEALHLWLTESAAQAKAQYFANARRKRR